MNPIAQKGGLSIAGLLVAGGCLVGPAATAQAAPTVASTNQPTFDRSSLADDPAEQLVDVDYQAQPNFYYCGPAATRMALSALGKALPQDEVARLLGTTQAGTDSALDVTRVLNELAGAGYRTTEIPDATARPAEVDQLRADTRRALAQGRPVVANVKGTVVDNDGTPHSYEGGHYLTLVGYRADGDLLRIADPAASKGVYWMAVAKVANWVAERGYSS